ncbi:MAG: diphosphomevalonate decarboxylase [Deltaproteobacteria bacterium]|nr:MAG: diphosphomevalonate decarboxylase [Deltaproteobacteria bacterium]
MRSARATACSNIALVKYWGKRADTDPDLNLPDVGSLSLTLADLATVTTVRPAVDGRDHFELDGVPLDGRPARRIAEHLDRVWAAAGLRGSRPACVVESENHLPTAAGLASSASGFAALTCAAAAAFEADLDDAALSALARRGSGSAARSIFGGFVRLDRGVRPDGSDCVARPVAGPDHWDVRLLVVRTTTGPKKVGSTEGMERCRTTSPYYRAWVETSEADLDAATEAVLDRDIDRLGPIMEHSCFKMHAAMMASRPPLLYWKGTTVDAIHEVWALREAGCPAYLTIDAGPHVKVLVPANRADEAAGRLRTVPGVEAVTIHAPGPAARVEVLP